MVHLNAMPYSFKLNQESLVEVSCCIFLLVGFLSSSPLKIVLRSKDFMQSRGLLIFFTVLLSFCCESNFIYFTNE